MSKFRVLLSTVAVSYLVPLSYSFSSQRTARNEGFHFLRLSTISVFDDVFPASTLASIDAEAKAGGPIGHSLFFRDSKPRSTVEACFDNLLDRLSDETRCVEYWWRDEWMSLEMHRDVDEYLYSQQDSVFRYPAHAHVLYLAVGKEVSGPTVVFDDDCDRKGDFNKLTIVPAKSGRLLRFSGHLMHAVPRPPLAYFDPSEGGSNLEQWTRVRPSEDDLNCPERTIFRRSVLLFNTWPDKPPLGIPVEPPTGTMQSYSFKDDNENCTLPRLPLSEVSIESFDGEGPLVRLKVGLLGNRKRRERADTSIRVLTPQFAKTSFLTKGGMPTSFSIKNT